VNSAKRYLLIALSFAICMTVFAAFAPRIAHAITATLVQVVNTAQNPVPSQPVATTQVLLDDEQTVGNFGIRLFGPVDVSGAKEVRVSCSLRNGASDYVLIIVLESPNGPANARIILKNPNDPSINSQLIELPGTSLAIELGGGFSGSSDVSCQVYGRAN
jgi:hypothetical protein